MRRLVLFTKRGAKLCERVRTGADVERNAVAGSGIVEDDVAAGAWVLETADDMWAETQLVPKVKESAGMVLAVADMELLPGRHRRPGWDLVPGRVLPHRTAPSFATMQVARLRHSVRCAAAVPLCPPAHTPVR